MSASGATCGVLRGRIAGLGGAADVDAIEILKASKALCGDLGGRVLGCGRLPDTKGDTGEFCNRSASGELCGALEGRVGGRRRSVDVEARVKRLSSWGICGVLGDLIGSCGPPAIRSSWEGSASSCENRGALGGLIGGPKRWRDVGVYTCGLAS